MQRYFFKFAVVSLFLLCLTVLFSKNTSNDHAIESNYARPTEEERNVGRAILRDYFRKRELETEQIDRVSAIKQYRNVLLSLNSSSRIDVNNLSEEFHGIKVQVCVRVCVYSVTI